MQSLLKTITFSLFFSIVVVFTFGGCDNKTEPPPKPKAVGKKIDKGSKDTAVAGGKIDRAEPSAGARIDRAEPSAGGKIDRAEPSAGGKIDRAEPSAGGKIDRAEPSAGGKIDRAEPSAGGKIDRAEPSAGGKIDRAEPSAGARIDRAEPSAGARIDRAEPSAGARFDRAEPSAGARFDRAEPSAGGKIDRAEPSAGARIEKTLGALPEKPALSSPTAEMEEGPGKDSANGKRENNAGTYIASVSNSSGQPGALPEIDTGPPPYDPTGKIDPFMPLFKDEPEIKEPVPDEPKEKTPPKRIPRTPLERIAIGQLHLVGVIQAESGNKGLVQESSGKGYIVSKGTYIGTNGGRVTEISKDKIVVEEEVQDILGKLTTQKRELKLQKPFGED